LKKQINLIKQFEWNLLDIDFGKIENNNISGKIKFRFYNKSDIEITIEEFYLDLYINNEYVGWLRDDGKFVIPAKGYNDLDFDFTLLPQFVLKNLMDIFYIATKQKDAILGLKGIAKAKSGFMTYVIDLNCDCSTKNVDCNCK
jgi:LEA14-like dessication related protein